jgi:glyceraldehyde 3-phosphate dehydrogenase
VTTRVGINGFGRIGRNFFRAVLAQNADIEIVGVNDLTDNQTLAHLLKYDSILGRLGDDVTFSEDNIVVGGRSIRALAERDPGALPWGDLAPTSSSSRPATSPTRPRQRRTLTAAPRRSSSPRRRRTRTSRSSWGVNDDAYDPAQHTVISNASCTTTASRRWPRCCWRASGSSRA